MRKIRFVAITIYCFTLFNYCSKDTMKEPVAGAIYRHYKGKEYKVVGVGYHTETLEKLVLYQALYDDPQFGHNAFWVRPIEMFMEDVVINEITQPRFALIESSEEQMRAS